MPLLPSRLINCNLEKNMGQQPQGQTFGIIENGKVRDMTPEEVERLSAIDEGEPNA